MNLADYFESRAAECRDQLKFAEKPGFALRQVWPGGGESDVTEQHKAGLRRAIEDYEKAAAIWREDNED